MKLYSSYYILQQKLAKAKSIKTIQALCKDHGFKVEVQLLISGFSNLRWELSLNHLSGRFIGHITTTIIQEKYPEKNATSSKPTIIHFETRNSVKPTILEDAVVQAIQENLNISLKKFFA